MIIEHLAGGALHTILGSLIEVGVKNERNGWSLRVAGISKLIHLTKPAVSPRTETESLRTEVLRLGIGGVAGNQRKHSVRGADHVVERTPEDDVVVVTSAEITHFESSGVPLVVIQLRHHIHTSVIHHHHNRWHTIIGVDTGIATEEGQVGV